MSFKRGDRVVCINSAGYESKLTAGRVYTVKCMEPHYVCIEQDDTEMETSWRTNRFKLVEDSKRTEIEQAMDVFEKYEIFRTSSGNYRSFRQLRNSRNISREAFLEELFPNPKKTKLKDLQEQIAELQNTANELEKEING